MLLYIKSVSLCFEGSNMICKYCGAKFKNDASECPFCKSENTELTDKIYHNRVGAAISKIKNVKEEVKHKERIFTKKAAEGFLVFVGVLLIATVLYYVISDVYAVIKSGREKEKEEAYLARLETYYQKGDYAGLHACYYDNKDVFTQKDQKYREVIYAWDYMSSIRRMMDAERIFPIDIYYVLEYYNKIYIWTEEKTNDNTVYGNEQILLDFISEAESFLRETLGMTEIQIETVKDAQLDVDRDNNSSLRKIADEICNRLGITEEKRY